MITICSLYHYILVIVKHLYFFLLQKLNEWLRTILILYLIFFWNWYFPCLFLILPLQIKFFLTKVWNRLYLFWFVYYLFTACFDVALYSMDNWAVKSPLIDSPPSVWKLDVDSRSNIFFDASVISYLLWVRNVDIFSQ